MPPNISGEKTYSNRPNRSWASLIFSRQFYWNYV